MEVLVVDAVGIIRTRVGRLLEGVPGVDAVDLAATPAEAAALLAAKAYRVVVVCSGLPGHPLHEVVRDLKRARPGAHYVVYFADAGQVPWQTPTELGVDLILDLPRESRALAGFVMQHVRVTVQWVQPNDRRRF